MEIGSFIEIELKDSGEYYTEEINTARLNSARAGIFHACRLYKVSNIYLPYYLCPEVRSFLIRKDIQIHYYNINSSFEPENFIQAPESAVLIANYFGVFSHERIKTIAKEFKNVIIDNGTAFYNRPVNNCYNVYSPRKFFGVPDGCYVIGRDAEKFTGEYLQDHSSRTSGFLLQRIEFGSDLTYPDRMINEQRIADSDVLRMSPLTRALLKSTDYSRVSEKRRVNFIYAHRLLKSINLINPTRFTSSGSVPMIYPLVVEDEDLVEKLKEKKIYTGRRWAHVPGEVNSDSFEAWFSRYMIPIPIDQRYCEIELKHISSIIQSGLNS